MTISVGTMSICEMVVSWSICNPFPTTISFDNNANPSVCGRIEWWMENKSSACKLQIPIWMCNRNGSDSCTFHWKTILPQDSDDEKVCGKPQPFLIHLTLFYGPFVSTAVDIWNDLHLVDSLSPIPEIEICETYLTVTN